MWFVAGTKPMERCIGWNFGFHWKFCWNVCFCYYKFWFHYVLYLYHRMNFDQINFINRYCFLPAQVQSILSIKYTEKAWNWLNLVFSLIVNHYTGNVVHIIKKLLCETHRPVLSKPPKILPYFDLFAVL